MHDNKEKLVQNCDDEYEQRKKCYTWQPLQILFSKKIHGKFGFPIVHGKKLCIKN